LHNRAGANLVTGLTATALAGSTLAGRPRADIGLFETDEAALPRALDETRPRLVLLHNLFRDQLDRYGEVDTVAANWRAALERLPLPGLYNALNALAAASAALLLDIAPAHIRDTLEGFSAAFGRIERIDAGGQPLLLALIKNPVGASETVRMLTSSDVQSPFSIAENEERRPVDHGPPTTDSRLSLLIAINDKYADGTDVSWLWDADFERLAGRLELAVVSGTRAGDMAVRLKYAGVEPARIA